MKKLIITISVSIILIGLVACVSNNLDSAQLAHHQNMAKQTMSQTKWNEREVSILKSLSLNYFTPREDKTNRVVNNEDAAKLGQKLFFDKRFSKDNSVSCSTCHKPELYFTDGLPQAVGLQKTLRNAPSIVGASNEIWFFRDGRTDSLWSQALHPIENSQEHGGNRSQFAQVIFNDPELKAEYEKVFGPMPDISDNSRFPVNAGPTRVKPVMKAWKSMPIADQKIISTIYVNGGKAIAAYESKLQPAPSRFDDYVKAVGDNDTNTMQSILSKDEVAGLNVFLNKGKCFICHNGPMFTDQGFHNIGTPPLNVKRYDFGRSKAVRRVKKNQFNCLSEFNDAKDKSCNELKYMVFHEEDTLAAFKTPSLRNVTKTAPYMHAGQYKTLKEVIKHYNDPPSTKVGMNKLLDIDLTDQEMAQLEAFLKSLNSPIAAEPALLEAPKNL